jgi:hypothetical protein
MVTQQRDRRFPTDTIYSALRRYPGVLALNSFSAQDSADLVKRFIP